MPKNKLCCRIFPIVAILIASGLVVLANWINGSDQLWIFLSEKDAFFNFLGRVLFAALGPIALFYYLVEKEKYQDRARVFALLGFLPVFLILMIL